MSHLGDQYLRELQRVSAATDELSRLRAENERLKSQREQAFENASKWAIERGEAITRADTATRALSDLRARIEKPDEAAIERYARALCLQYEIDDGFDAKMTQHSIDLGMWRNHVNQLRAVLSALSKDLTADKEDT